MNENDLPQDASITTQAVESERPEYQDIFIPIVRYGNSNLWMSLGLYYDREMALSQIRNNSCADAKILIHSERLIKFGETK